MRLSPQQLAAFRDRVRSELNQMLGYSELLLLDEVDTIPETAQQRVAELQASTRRILRTSQSIFAGDILDEAELRAQAKSAMGDVLATIERNTAQLLNEFPTELLGEVQRIQAAYLSLKAALDRPFAAARANHRSNGKTITLDSAYSSSIPLEVALAGHLLLVDDSESQRDLIGTHLNELGLAVTSVPDGPSALAQLATKHFDCVVLSLTLPGMSGPAVLSTIRANPQWNSTPVLMLSGLDELSEAERCIEIGAEDYIIRPVGRSMLRAKLHSSIQRRRLYEDCQHLGRDLDTKSEELNRFVMVASHDMQAPLRTLQGNLVALGVAMEEKREADAVALLQDSTQRCDNMTALLRDLLLYSSLGQLRPFAEFLQLDWVVSEALANLNQDVEASGVEVIRTPLPSVQVDFKQMLYVLQNLLSNAIQYRSEKSPYIQIGSEEREDEFLIYVADNGCGIAESQQEKIFQPFFRLHGENVPGTGLGLAIARRAVEQAGGRIWVSSEDGGGSRFSFTLPRVVNPQQ